MYFGEHLGYIDPSQCCENLTWQDRNMNIKRRNRILLAKPGLDGHDRGIKVVAMALKDAGFEVIYTGLHQTPNMIVRAAVEEDVDMIGLSILAGAHIEFFHETIELLKQNRAEDILVVGGGIIPEEDVSALESMGVAEIFFPETTLNEIVEKVISLLKEKKQVSA